LKGYAAAAENAKVKPACRVIIFTGGNTGKRWKFRERYGIIGPSGGRYMDKRAYAASDQTKQALAAALKELMAQKPIDKITIRDITDRCDIRRQNFYYHFADVYDLMRWMFQEEAMSLLRQHEGALLWQEGLLQLFRYIEENRAVCLCALRSVGREHLKRFFEADVHNIIHRTVEQIGREIGVTDRNAGCADIELTTHFYVVAMSGMLESWLLGEIERTPEELIAFADRMLQDHVRGAALRIQASKPGKE